MFRRATDASRRVRFLRFWQSARGFWTTGPGSWSWLLTISLTLVVFVSLAITYGLNLWNRHFFDALEAKDGPAALHQAIVFPLLVGAYLMLCVFAMWARMTMQRTWRAWLNDHILDRWLDRGRYYQLELLPGDHKNPEHRINDDLRIATEMPVDFVSGFLTSVLSAVTFIAVLWTVGGALAVPVGDHAITVPGFLVVAAVVYAAINNGAMLAIARRFIPITEQKNQAEAEYRFRLTRVRTNAESIALLHGERAERAGLDGGFATVFARWRDLMGQHMRAVIVSQGSAQLCGVVPVLLCTPRYLDGTMTLGQVVQVASAFTIVQGALSWIADNYTRLADWTASVQRGASLLLALDALDGAATPSQHPPLPAGGPLALELRRVGVGAAEGVPIVREASLSIRSRERVLVVGESGAGKSSLVRAIAGLWPWTTGDIRRVPDGRMMVLPQNAYVPIGSLRDAVTYPQRPHEIAPSRVVESLEAVGLVKFLDRLDEVIAWDQVLSQGEKQRLALARLLVHRPDVVILDEATSALHVAGQDQVMTALFEHMPDVTLLSIGHRPELEAFHARKITLQSQDGGAIVGADQRLWTPGRPGRAPIQRPLRAAVGA